MTSNAVDELRAQLKADETVGSTDRLLNNERNANLVLMKRGKHIPHAWWHGYLSYSIFVRFPDEDVMRFCGFCGRTLTMVIDYP